MEDARLRLAEAFRVGYARTGLSALDTTEDVALLALHRAHRSLWNARRRWRQRRYREIPAYLVLAHRWRRTVRRLT